MDLGLKDKLIVVGGGAGSLGSAICQTLREEDAKVLVADIIKGLDLSDPEQVNSFFQELRP